jgi:hypothetical protein
VGEPFFTTRCAQVASFNFESLFDLVFLWSTTPKKNVSQPRLVWVRV